VIEIHDWPRTATLGGAVVVTLAVSSPRPVATVTLDLLDDGLPGVTVQLSGNPGGFGALGIVARRAGTFRVDVSATDTAGCSDRTGAVRFVQVTRQ